MSLDKKEPKVLTHILAFEEAACLVGKTSIVFNKPVLNPAPGLTDAVRIGTTLRRAACEFDDGVIPDKKANRAKGVNEFALK